MRLTHLTLKNWRNFKQADFGLRDRLFIVGPNASGKSNLLDALRFLKQIASAGGGFQDAVASRGGIARVRCLAARNFNHGRVTLSISMGDDETPDEWSYEITFSSEPRGRHRPILTSEIVKHRGEVIIERPTDEDVADPERMTQTYLEQVNANREFRRIVDFVESIRYLHLVPHLMRNPERVGNPHGDPYGSDLLLRMAKTPERTRGRNLRRISQALKTAVPQLDRLELVRDEIGHWHLEARYRHWRPQPARHDERLFSDGTLRLIGLLWTLLDGKGDQGSHPAGRAGALVAHVGRTPASHGVQPNAPCGRAAGAAFLSLARDPRRSRNRDGRGGRPRPRRGREPRPSRRTQCRTLGTCWMAA